MNLLQSHTPDTFNRSRKVTVRDVRGVPYKWRFVLELFLAGHKAMRSLPGKPSIHELTGYAEPTIYAILQKEEMIALKQQIMAVYDIEFESLYPEVINAIEVGLRDPDKYLDAAKVYLKEFGKSEKGKATFTAEDMVFNILNQQQQGDSGATT